MVQMAIISVLVSTKDVSSSPPCVHLPQILPNSAYCHNCLSPPFKELASNPKSGLHVLKVSNVHQSVKASSIYQTTPIDSSTKELTSDIAISKFGIHVTEVSNVHQSIKTSSIH